jgi:SAM-dependent methyltransferase
VESYDSAIYGERIADVYDELYSWYEEEAVAGLAGLARGGRALELGIGTGRIALPLAARGIEVHGIDASPAMVSRLKRKPGGADIPVTLGDFREIQVPVTFSLVYVVFNTFFGLLTQADQVTCFENVAQGKAFLASSHRHVSVYERPAGSE